MHPSQQLQSPFQHEHPLTTHWNPQLDLFLEPPAGRPAGDGELSQALWRRQERRLARKHSSATWRRMAADNDRRRPGPEQRPREAHYDWAWPSFTSLALDAGLVRAPPSFFTLTGLQTAEQEQALAELLCEIAQHVAFALSRPCPVYETPDQLRVEFLGCIAWVANRRQRNMLQLELRDRDGRWQLAAAGFDLEHALGDGEWLAQALLSWLPQIERSFGGGAREAYHRLREKLVLHFRERRFHEATERQVYRCLVHSAPLGRLLRTLKPYAVPRFPSSFLYSQLAAREAFWANLELRAPGLVVFLYAALRCKLLLPNEGIGDLRELCLCLGMTPAGWRFLCRFGTWAYADMLRPGADGLPPIEDAIAYVQWQAEAGLKQPLPAAYAEAVLHSGAIQWQEDEDAGVAVVIDPRLAQVAEAQARISQATDPRGEVRAPIGIEAWEEVVHWWVTARPELDRNQWRAGWPAIRRVYQRWLARAMSEPWDCALGPAHRHVWVVRPLVCGRDLVAEGERMRHCASNYMHDCLRGTHRFFTVEERASGKPVATFNLVLREGRWEIGDVRGKCNADPDSDMWGMATVTCNSYNRAAAGEP